jgi:hypothetical protein
LELPLLSDKLVNYINKTSVAGMWSQNAIQATNAWLKEGLKQRCITRDLKWGVPVPHEKYKDKVWAHHYQIRRNSAVMQLPYFFYLIVCRCSMFGLMHQLGTYLSQHPIRLIGRNGGKILIM